LYVSANNVNKYNNSHILLLCYEGLKFSDICLLGFDEVYKADPIGYSKIYTVSTEDLT